MARCENCGKPFKKQKRHQRFHSDECRKEFHRAGGVSFARQRYLIEQLCERETAALRERVVRLEADVDRLTAAISLTRSR